MRVPVRGGIRHHTPEFISIVDRTLRSSKCGTAIDQITTSQRSQNRTTQINNNKQQHHFY